MIIEEAELPEEFVNEIYGYFEQKLADLQVLVKNLEIESR